MRDGYEIRTIPLLVYYVRLVNSMNNINMLAKSVICRSADSILLRVCSECYSCSALAARTGLCHCNVIASMLAAHTGVSTSVR